ncbi:caspase family protein [Mesorhizobium australafricanum]|uniref:caspase family protein n=1 Tax=Mesorhizobium australafricanum TaxID=3072311 RepID=UPI003D313976
MQTLQKFIGLIVVLIVAVASATGALAQEQKRLAFVIGNAAYSSGELATPANDAGLIGQTLQAAGFDVVGARDVDQESLRGAFRDFLAKVSAAGPDAVVFVYLAGHGAQFEGENYFLPVDANIANPADVPLQAIRVSDLTRPLAALPTKVNIIVLDAARPNAFPQTKEPLAGGLALVDPDPNMLIAFNAAPGTAAPEGKGPYGPYAQALAEMMREGGLPLEDVFDRTRLRVNEVTQGAEVPWDASKISAPFVFFDRAPDAPAPRFPRPKTKPTGPGKSAISMPAMPMWRPSTATRCAATRISSPPIRTIRWPSGCAPLSPRGARRSPGARPGCGIRRKPTGPTWTAIRTGRMPGRAPPVGAFRRRARAAVEFHRHRL